MDLAQFVALSASVGLVVVAWWKLALLIEQSRTTFEDGLTGQYRTLMESIPMDVWLGSELQGLDAEQRFVCREAIFRYLDLSNEQAFLQKQGRVRLDTWEVWKRGIEANMKLPAFDEVWREVMQKAPANFEYLRDMLQ